MAEACGKHGPVGAFECHSCEEDDHRDAATYAARRQLLLASVFCVVFMVAEAVGGYFAGSLAIMTDAAHLLSDLASFLISVFALWITSKPATEQLSFGFHRAEIIGALLSVLIIWALTAFLLVEAVRRVKNPQDVDGRLMFIVSVVGVVVNTIMAFILHKTGHGHGHVHSHEEEQMLPLLEDQPQRNLNVRAALIHILGDLVQSIGVMVAAIVIWVHPSLTIVDPICTFLFSLIVLATTFGLVRDSMHVLMEGTPEGIDRTDVQRELEAVPSVMAVHDLHIWSIKIGRPALSVHLMIGKEVNDATVLQQAQSMLYSSFHICHSTIQIERSA